VTKARAHSLSGPLTRWGCAGRSYPSHSTSRSPPPWWERGSQREQDALIRSGAGIGRVLVWACFVRRTFSPHLAYCGWYTRVRLLARDSRHRAASAGLLATAGEPASCVFPMRCIRHARVPLAAAGMRLNRRLRWPCVRYHGTRCDLSEVAAPEWLPHAACRNYLGISCMSADARASGRLWATVVALASRTSRGSSSLRHQCAVCTAGLGMRMRCDSCG
jgi:hypothetical protein